MGVHFLKPDRLHDGMLKAEEPEMLIYEPGPGRTFRLVGVEYLVLASEWAARNGNPNGSFADWNSRVSCDGQSP